MTLQTGPSEPDVPKQRIDCPWCGHVEWWGLGRRLLWIAKGHEPPPEVQGRPAVVEKVSMFRPSRAGVDSAHVEVFLTD